MKNEDILLLLFQFTFGIICPIGLAWSLMSYNNYSLVGILWGVLMGVFSSLIWLCVGRSDDKK